MVQISLLRKIVANGWTIANRKNVINTLGRGTATELAELSAKRNLGIDVFEYSQVSSHLTEVKAKELKTVLQRQLGIVPMPVKQVKKYPGVSYCLPPQSDVGGTVEMSHCLPKDYVDIKVDKVFYEAEPEHYSRFGKRIIPAKEAHWEVEETHTLKPHFYIPKLYSAESGYGARSVQGIVESSLKSPKSQGRVMLFCSNEDKLRPCPAGFYYKLGFRFKLPSSNEKFAQWIKNGGKRADAPMEYGDMYLPKENIIDCLSYGYK